MPVGPIKRPDIVEQVLSVKTTHQPDLPVEDFCLVVSANGPGRVGRGIPCFTVVSKPNIGIGSFFAGKDPDSAVINHGLKLAPRRPGCIPQILRASTNRTEHPVVDAIKLAAHQVEFFLTVEVVIERNRRKIGVIKIRHDCVFIPFHTRQDLSADRLARTAEGTTNQESRQNKTNNSNGMRPHWMDLGPGRVILEGGIGIIGFSC